MRTRNEWYRKGYKRANQLNRLRSPLESDEPSDIAPMLAEPDDAMLYGYVSTMEGPRYTPRRSGLMYTTRRMISPTTGMRLPFETPIFVEWSDYDRIADIGVELVDDCIEARFLRADNSGSLSSCQNSAVAIAAQGLSFVLRGECDTISMHEALSQEIARARANYYRSIELGRKLMYASPISSWWAAQGVDETYWGEKMDRWEHDRAVPYRWPHFRREMAQPASDFSELETPLRGLS